MHMLELGKIGDALLEAFLPHRAVSGMPHGEDIGLPDEHALRRRLASGGEGYWALLAVHVEEIARLDDRGVALVRWFLVRRLGEILNDEVSIYQTGSGLALLAGPGEDAMETGHGTRMLREAVTRKLTEPISPGAGIPSLTLSIEASTDELSRLCLDRRARRGGWED
jgi:hypothetical protein